MVVIPYYSYYIQIGFFDVMLIALIEIAFIWFFFPKEMMGKVFSMVGAVNLIKLGIMTILIPYVPSITSTFNQILLIEVTMMFLLGIIVSTLIYEKEQWAPSREEAGSLAFRITAISSLVWVTFRSINPSIQYGFQSHDPIRSLLAETSMSNIIPFNAMGLVLDSFGVFILVAGFIILYLRYKKHLLFQRNAST
ncbi:hypothetical protein [Candidatus Hodarchaeum mangrovi]